MVAPGWAWLALTILFLGASAPAQARIRVVASITDLGSIAAAVGGDEVEVAAIARPNADPHRVEVLPSYMVRVSRADIYLKVGLGLDQWASSIIDGSHNSHVLIIDCSIGLEALEKPAGRVDASMGDAHPSGNPHYWLDPANGARIANLIADALARKDPSHAADFQARAEVFAQKCAEVRTLGREAAEALPVRRIVTYHQSWVYFADAFGIALAGTVEPVPGIPPTAKHLRDLVQVIREQQVPLLLQEPYFSSEAGEFLARETGIRVSSVSPSCDDVGPDSYLEHFRELSKIVQDAR
jgi:ABC-type Zn uptake system ZnuABC Zn-binding protein ZnuA